MCPAGALNVYKRFSIFFLKTSFKVFWFFERFFYLKNVEYSECKNNGDLTRACTKIEKSKCCPLWNALDLLTFSVIPYPRSTVILQSIS